MTVEFWILIGTWFLAIGTLLGTAYLRNWRIARQKVRMPVAEKLLRGPGESLRKKLEELDEQLSVEMAMAFVLPLLYVGSILVGNVIVVSGRAVKTLVKGRRVFEPVMIERLAHQLDQRCRDVDF